MTRHTTEKREVAAEVKANLLLAEDDPAIRESLVEVLEDEGYRLVATSDGDEAIKALGSNEFDLVLSDLRMPRSDGIEVLRHCREIAPQTLVVLMTAHATVETAVEALRRGASDYLLKPILFEELLRKIEQLLKHRQLAWENQILRTQMDRDWDFENLVGRSPAMEDVMHLVRRVAPTPSTVLITGESGVGKEVVARAVHYFSEFREHVFLPVNCGAIPEALLESQLFGHLRGAFTGASSNQEGLFQHARGGTIFLDEIGDLPLNLQVKLLRAIEEKEVLPVGATTPIQVAVRVIAATNRELEHAVADGAFREDLYYRLNVVNIEIPPLRDRREDIPPLVEHFIWKLNRELKKSYKGADGATMKLLLSFPWKGNVRELANVLEHAMILGGGEWITTNDLPRILRQDVGLVGPAGDDLRDALRAYEKVHVRQVLAKAENDKKVAAERLGLSLSSLYRKIEEHGLNTPRGKAASNS